MDSSLEDSLDVDEMVVKYKMKNYLQGKKVLNLKLALMVNELIKTEKNFRMMQTKKDRNSRNSEQPLKTRAEVGMDQNLHKCQNNKSQSNKKFTSNNSNKRCAHLAGDN